MRGAFFVAAFAAAMIDSPSAFAEPPEANSMAQPYLPEASPRPEAAPAWVVFENFPPEHTWGAQLRIELLAMGFRLSGQERHQGSATVVRFASQDVVELILLKGSRVTMERPPDLPPRLFAMRVAEQIRAGLLVSQLKPEAQEVAAPEKESTLAEERPPTENATQFTLAVGASLEVASGGLGSAARVAGQFAWWPFKSWGISSFGYFPVHSQQVVAAEGSAEVSIISLGLGPSFRHRFDLPLEFQTGAGAGGAVVSMTGVAQAPQTGVSDTVIPALAYAYVAGDYFFSRSLFLELRTTGLVYLPPITVNFADEQVAERKFVTCFALGLGLAL